MKFKQLDLAIQLVKEQGYKVKTLNTKVLVLEKGRTTIKLYKI